MSTFFLLFMTFCMVRTIDKWVNNVLFVHGTLSVPLVEFLLFFKYRYNIFHVLDSLELTVKRKTFKTI